MEFSGEARRLARMVAGTFPGTEVWDAKRSAWRTIRLLEPKEEEDGNDRQGRGAGQVAGH